MVPYQSLSLSIMQHLVLCFSESACRPQTTLRQQNPAHSRPLKDNIFTTRSPSSVAAAGVPSLRRGRGGSPRDREPPAVVEPERGSGGWLLNSRAAAARAEASVTLGLVVLRAAGCCSSLLLLAGPKRLLGCSGDVDAPRVAAGDSLLAIAAAAAARLALGGTVLPEGEPDRCSLLRALLVL